MRAFGPVFTICVALAGEASALVPSLFDVLWPEHEPESLPALTGGDGRTAWLESEREVVLEGGNVPDVILRRDAIRAGGGVDRPGWSAIASTGVSDARAQAFFETWGGRWIPATETEYDISLRVGRKYRGGARFAERDGNLRATLGGVVPIGPAGLFGDASRTRGRGALLLVGRGGSSVPLEWDASGWDARAGAYLEFGELGRVTAAISNEESHPGSTEGRYRLEVRTIGTGWQLGWRAPGPGPWIEVESRGGEWRSEGWSDTLGSDVRFHDLRMSSRMRGLSAGWRFGNWSLALRGEERTVEAPKSSYFTPFISWNSLGVSDLAPVDLLLSDQREHLSGGLEYRSIGAGAMWTRPGRRFDLGAGGDLSWLGLDAHLLRRSTRMDFLGTRWSLATDSIGAPRLRLALLAIHGRSVVHLGGFGDLGLHGRMAIPLWLVRLRSDGAEPSTSSSSSGGDGGNDPSGLWSLGASWTGCW